MPSFTATTAGRPNSKLSSVPRYSRPARATLPPPPSPPVISRLLMAVVHGPPSACAPRPPPRESPVAAAHGDALDADEDLHRGSAPDPGVLRVEQRDGPGDRDRDRVLLTEVLHREAGALAGLLGGQVRHQQVLAHRRPSARARHVGG